MAQQPDANPKRAPKDRILDVVEDLCATVGPHRLQHATVAQTLGIKPPSLYAHFKSMSAIIEAVTLRALVAIEATYDNLDPTLTSIEKLNESQSRQIDLLVKRPGIARLVLLDLSQPGGSETISWQTPEIVRITGIEKQLFESAVAENSLETEDFSLWFGRRLGGLYVALSYQWLRIDTLSAERIADLKRSLTI